MPFLRFIPETTNIDFVRLRYFAFAFDGLLLLVSHRLDRLAGLQSGHRFHRRRAAGGQGGPGHRHRQAMRSQMNTLGFGEFQIQISAAASATSPPIFLRADPRAAQRQLTGQIRPPTRSRPSSARPTPSAAPRWWAPRSARNCSAPASSRRCWPIVLIALWVAVRFEWQYGIGAAHRHRP